jgi:hypothetical protein
LTTNWSLQVNYVHLIVADACAQDIKSLTDDRPGWPTTRRMASFNEGPLTAVKPTFKCPCKEVDERP